MTLDWTAKDVLTAVAGRSLCAQDWSAHGVSIDSRTVVKDDLFVAIKGDSMDGHAYVRAALDAGAIAAIVSHQPPQVPPDARLIFVDDTFTALQALGMAGRARTKAKIVGVTGSVGKTSSKEQLRVMLGALGFTHANEGNLNNHWGAPLTLARMPQDSVFGVIELGMNHAGELGPLSQQVRPHVALITNVEAVHLEFFDSTASIAQAKAEIFLGLDPEGCAVLNRDNPHYNDLASAAQRQGIKRIWSFGRHPESKARLLSLHADENGTDVEALILGDKISYRLNVAGEHLAFNALGTLLACAALGADTASCADALAAYRLPEGRGSQRVVALKEGGSITLIDETYNASPVATKAAIAVLGAMRPGPQGRRILALGDMRELGETAIDLHLGLADTIYENRIDLVHCCGGLMAHLHETLPPAIQGKLRPTSEDLAPLVAADLHDGDILMLKGSHGMHMETIISSILATIAQPPSTPQRKLAG